MIRSSAFRPEIEGLRAVAVLLVVLFHAQVGRLSGGFIGVDVFFVISGFVVTVSIMNGQSKGHFSLADFYKRRAWRLLPALFTTLLVTTALAAFVLAPDELVNYSKTLLSSLLSVSNIYFWLHSGYFDPSSAVTPLLHIWSLSIEEQFYLVWPVLMVAYLRFPRQTILCIIVASVASFAGAALLEISSNAKFYLLPFRIYQFATGCLIALYAERLKKFRSGWLSSAGIAIILAAAAKMTGQTGQALVGLAASFGTALILIGGNMGFAKFVLSNPASRFLGRISYSVYLAHWPVIVFYALVVTPVFTQAEKVALTAASIFFGALLYYGVENPLRLPPRESSIKWAALGSAFAVVAAMALGMAQSGWIWRIADRQHYINAENKYGGAACDSIRCEVGSGKKGTIILIGDSHGKAYFHGLKTNFPDHKIVVYESSGCQFFSREFKRDYGDAPQYSVPCDEARRKAYAEIEATKGATIVLAQNWTNMPMLRASDGMSVAKRDDAAFAEFAADESLKLAASMPQHHFVVVGNVPTTGTNLSPKACLLSPVRKEAACLTTPLSRLASKLTINEKLARIGRAFFNPFDALCNKMSCANFAQDLPLYFDDNHLSEVGSDLVVTSMRGAISGKLADRKMSDADGTAKIH